jgi:DNA-directed RNA polymerase beta' subunit
MVTEPITPEPGTGSLREILGSDRPVDFDTVSISVASPEIIRNWSRGEVKNPETINYRTFKPEKGGLFCERIFGPTKDWECACGKYKRIKYKGVTCDRCGVEVTLARVRRERMGHIDLAVPVSHIWFYKCMPSRLGLMMDMTARTLERVIYYEDYIVVDPGKTPLEFKQLLTEQEFREARDQFGDDAFVAMMGAEGIREILKKLNLEETQGELEIQMENTRSKQTKKKIAKRLKLVQGFISAHQRPEWMILEVLPVIPPDLRPLVPLEGGRFATSDLNDLYRRVINRNNRLKNLLNLKTPDVIIRNEKRMLQEAVDALIDNGRHGRPVMGAGNRPFKSLSDMLKGKTGRFRQNLLGKRVDYSGRSVIVIGPELKLNQCGLPKKMALVLFEPFIIRKLKELGQVHTVRSAKKVIERQETIVWDILDEVTRGHPVLLNRAPTLHRLSIQGFEPVLIEGEAVRIHPLVCTAYNADFDGDQMAVHVPLSVEAQLEARLLMLATNNIFSPSSGKAITTPSQDITLGCYYLTQNPRIPAEREKKDGDLPLFGTVDEVMFALAERSLRTHSRIRIRNPDFVPESLRKEFGEFLVSLKSRELDDSKARAAVQGLAEQVRAARSANAFSEPLRAASAKLRQAVKGKKFDQEAVVSVLGSLADLGERSSAVTRALLPNVEKLKAGLAEMSAHESQSAVEALAQNLEDAFETLENMPLALRGLARDLEVLAAAETIDIVAAERRIMHASARPFGDSKTEILATTVGRVIFNEIWPRVLGFYNKPAGKKALGEIILRCFHTAGKQATVVCLDRMKQLGFEEATRAGISIGIADMIIPPEKAERIKDAHKKIAVVEKQYQSGVITDGERYNKIVDIWTNAGEEIANVMLRTIEHNEGRDEMNPVYLMVDSGARGNRQQVKQLAGMRGLMAKPSGDIIERPILANFREGLTVLEYFISTHGARKGLADTALKTADSGYMTRKLCDVAMDVVVNEDDCKTLDGIWVQPIYEGEEEVVKLTDRIYGRTSCDDIIDPLTQEVIVRSGEVIREPQAKAINHLGIERVKIRSVLTCATKHGVCAKCYGLNLATSETVKLGESVGIIAAQSIGEPGTQLTMRTFHIGGTASQVFKQPQIKAKQEGRLQYNDLRVVESAEGKFIALNKNGSIGLHAEDGRELEKYTIVIGSSISVADGGKVKKGEVFVEWDPYNVPILTEKSGVIEFADIIEGVTMKRETNDSTGLVESVIIEHKEDLHPQIAVRGPDGALLASYSIPAGAHIEVKGGQKVRAGDRLAKTPRKVAKTKDITGGLPRVAELFEARRPKDSAEIAKVDGVVDIGGMVRGKRRLIVKDGEGNEEEHLIPTTKHIIVYKGDVVKKGQQLTEGPVVPHEILDICGAQALQEYLLNEVQEVYRLQGVEINDKHIEIIVRQMLRKVKITDPGDTDFLWDEQVDRLALDEENERIKAAGGKPAQAKPVLLGITKASLETESFISAASFQDTTRVLTDAATLGKVDRLRGFKENVIMGHLIPAGTGFKTHRAFKLKRLGEEVGEPLVTIEKEEERKAPLEITAQLGG